MERTSKEWVLNVAVCVCLVQVSLSVWIGVVYVSDVMALCRTGRWMWSCIVLKREQKGSGQEGDEEAKAAYADACMETSGAWWVGRGGSLVE